MAGATTPVHRNGHLGAALLSFAPVALVLTGAGTTGHAVLCAVGVAGLSRIPDYDRRLPFVAHRGATHTLVFALVVGAGTGLVAHGVAATAEYWVIDPAPSLGASQLIPSTSRALPFVWGSLVGTLAVLSHLWADALTPAGVPLLWPVSDARYSLGLVGADDPVGNAVLLVGGALATAAWAWPAVP